MTSIRRRLLVVLFITIAAALMAGAYGTYRLAWREVNELFDYQLRQLALSQREPASGAKMASDPLDAEFDFVIQVRNLDGTVRYQSDPAIELPQLDEAGWSTGETAAGTWRMYLAHRRNRSVLVAQPIHVRERVARNTAMRMLTPFLLLSPFLAAAIWWLIGIGLKPLDRLATSLSRRMPETLCPLSTENLPRELLPLAQSLNGLLGRLGDAMAAQRTFVADAAHELRTPITALRLNVQLADRAVNDIERQESLAELRLGLERASHVVQQLLTLARQEPGGGEERQFVPFVPLEISALVAQVVADHSRLAESRKIDLGLAEASAARPIRGDPVALRSLLGNLVDNAVRYTPTGGRVDIHLLDRDQALCVRVDDSGPGIPMEDRERVFDRFYRRSEAREDGSGLGLAIVQAIAKRHGARLLLGESVLGGLSVEVIFPYGDNSWSPRQP